MPTWFLWPAHRRRLLLVDDDETFRYVFHQMLGEDAAFELIDAVDGEEGLRRAREDEPDLIVLDLQMPRRDGFEVLKELAADPRLRHIPVLVSTSLRVTPELRGRLPRGIGILSKQDVSRESLALLLKRLAGDRLAS